MWQFFGTLISIHLFGILLKAIYYRYQHPWMPLSLVYKRLGQVLQVILALIGLALVVAMPISVHMLSNDDSKVNSNDDSKVNSNNESKVNSDDESNVDSNASIVYTVFGQLIFLVRDIIFKIYTYI